MKAVVTGGSGFIGSAIVSRLASEGADVVVADIVPPRHELPQGARFVECDVRHFDEVLRVLADAEEVYDVAGVLGTAELLQTTARAIDTNVRGAVNVLEASRLRGVQRIFHPTKPNDWLNTYSITKYAAEQFCLMYKRQYGMSVSVLKWFNAYGPRQHLYPVRKAVPLFIAQAIAGEPLTVYGDGEQTVDMIYVDDIAEIAVETTRKWGTLEKVVDVGTGDPVTVNQVARAILELTGSASDIVYLPMRPGEPEDSDIRADVADLKSLMPTLVFTDFRLGLESTIEYYADLPDNELAAALLQFR